MAMAKDFDWNAALRGELGGDAKSNAEWLKGISEDLDRIVKGRMYVDGDGMCVRLGEGEEIPEGCEEATMDDYLAENYGVDVTVSLGREPFVKSASVMVAFGGPNIYIDTGSELVEMYWWTTYACYPLTCEAVSALNDWAQYCYECCYDNMMRE